jgi:riboflavin synthase
MNIPSRSGRTAYTMFTGIIEEIGTIKQLTRGTVQKITIASNLKNAKGDSVAIQGICLTVTNVTAHGFSVEAVRQTERITTLNDWHKGKKVNCERALKLGDRLGGHIMLGHIDEVAKCIRRAGATFHFQVSTAGAKYLVPKGSIGIDGVSLTISEVMQTIFTVNIIPFTADHTTLGAVRSNSFVNVEFDYLAKFMRPQ